MRLSKSDDLTGKRFNNLTVIEYSHIENRQRYWLCKCDCGKVKKVTSFNLTKGRIKSCGCLTKKGKDLTGKRFGMLTVIEKLSEKSKFGNFYYRCACDCGNEKILPTAYLTRGASKSCGCNWRIGKTKKQEKIRFGETIVMNNGLKATIIEYKGVNHITVQFENGCKVKTYYGTFKRGHVRCPMLYEPIEDYIKCTNPNVGLSFLIDKDDFDKIKGIRWSLQSNGYLTNGKGLLLHRYIMDCPKGMYIDHINHDKLDNRKSNLRICTQSENCMNRGKKKNSHCQYKGVSRMGNKWEAHICKNKKLVYLGTFLTPELAHEEYCKAAKRLHGEFAKLA